MIHVLDFNDKIIDFLSTDDPSLVRAIHKRNVNDNSEMLELLISSERAEKFRERHRVIIRDSNKQWREFIINWVQDTMDGYTEIECIASYLADITTAKPYAPGKFEKKITSEALKDVLSDTGWEVSEQTEYDGLRTTSWTSYQTRYEVLKQLCTTYKMVLDFYIELSSNTVKGRYVVLKKKSSLFKGKEIEYGKDLVGLTRKIDMSEIKTALIAVGPENDKGKRLELVVTDDEAQSQFNLPTRYIWGIYEPQSDDQNMNETRLRSLAKTELNKRKSAVMSYEITSTDLEVTYPHEIISIGDTVRVKHRDFNPPLYVEAEVIAEEYNIISENSTYTFGQPKEFKESELREEFNKRLNIIHQKLNDNISNINTIVKDVVDSELEYFERKIHKSDTPPENPVNDMLWYDTSNPDVAVLRRYWNGRWIEETPNDVEKLGGITREKALFSELNNIFINLSIQHASLLSEATELLNSEYLVDNDLKADLQASLDAVIDVYNQIKNNLESMTPETATIGRLVDTKTLFLEYRKKLQDVYTDVEDVKIAISDRFKLLQSQYTDEKYKEALEIIATKFGLTVNEDLQLVGEPNVVKSAIEAARESTKEQLRDYVKTSDYKTDKDGIVERLDTAEAERTTLKGEIKDKVTLNEYRNGLEEQKQYTDDQLSDLSNNPEIKASIEQANQEAQEALKSYIDAQDDLKEKESQAYADGKISEEEQRAIQDAQAKLEEAKQNAELKARNAEKKANAYTDNKVKESTDAQRKTLTRYGSQIIQNGKEIKLRTTKEEFNASKRTLSRVLADITVNAMKGIYLRYDENGAITSHTIDKDGVKISGDKVDITANREFNVVANNINNKVGKNDIVNSLNLSNEGLDINVNRIGIKGGNANRYVQVQNDFIELGGIVQRTWKGKRSTDDIFTRLKDGHLRFRNNTAGGSLYMSHFGISTLMEKAKTEVHPVLFNGGIKLTVIAV